MPGAFCQRGIREIAISEFREIFCSGDGNRLVGILFSKSELFVRLSFRNQSLLVSHLRAIHHFNESNRESFSSAIHFTWSAFHRFLIRLMDLLWSFCHF
jgi:hypothetical protein